MKYREIIQPNTGFVYIWNFNSYYVLFIRSSKTLHCVNSSQILSCLLMVLSNNFLNNSSIAVLNMTLYFLCKWWTFWGWDLCQLLSYCLSTLNLRFYTFVMLWLLPCKLQFSFVSYFLDRFCQWTRGRLKNRRRGGGTSSCFSG